MCAGPAKAKFHIPLGWPALASCSHPHALPGWPTAGHKLASTWKSASQTFWYQNNPEGKGCSDLWSPGIGLPALLPSSPTHTGPKVRPINIHPDLGCPGVKQCRNQQALPGRLRPRLAQDLQQEPTTAGFWAFGGRGQRAGAGPRSPEERAAQVIPFLRTLTEGCGPGQSRALPLAQEKKRRNCV